MEQLTRTNLQILYQNKNRDKKELEKLKNRYIKIIYVGVSNKKSKKDIHKELYDLTINSKSQNITFYKQSLRTLHTIYKQMPKKDDEIIEKVSKVHNIKGIADISVITSMLVFDLLNKNETNKNFEREIYKELNKKEGETKEKLLNNSLIYNRELTIPKVFYLASGHNDCALDHKDAQFKMFIDEKWKSTISDKELRKEIQAYINKNNVKTVQWVTHRPVWFVTRPNCRHYFKALTTEEVLHISRKDLIEQYDMHRQVGERQYLQTINHPRNREWYKDIENAKSILNKYKERLRQHRVLYTSQPNSLLKNAINKDLTLIKKWTTYLQSRIN